MNIKSFDKHNLNTSEIPGADITLEDFDNLEGTYYFSDDYMKKKERLLDSLNDEPSSHIFRHKPYQIAAVFALALILLPSTCYAAVHYYKVHIQKEHYQTDISVTPNAEDGTDIGHIEFKPVKLVFNYLPAGSETLPGDDSKYYVPSDENESAHGISPILNKLDTNEDIVFSTLSSLSASEFMAGENRAYIVKKDSSFEYDKMLYVIFEKEHYLVEAYLGFDITEDEVHKIAEGITLEETNEENATTAVSLSKNDPKKEIDGEAEITSKLPSSYYKKGEVLPSSDLYSDCKMTVEKVEFFDSINGFDAKNFSPIDDMSTFVDDSGKLKTCERNEWVYGDGVNTLSKIINTETVGRKFVYVTVSVTNSSDADENDFSVYNQLMLIDETTSGRLEIAEKPYNYDDLCLEPQYFDSSLVSNTDQHFFYTKIPAGETVTYHLGYFIDDDLTDNIFFQAYYGSSYGAGDSDYSLTDIREK